MPVYVDDSCVTGYPDHVVKDFLKRSKKIFKITVEPLEKMVGIQIEYQKNGNVLLH